MDRAGPLDVEGGRGGRGARIALRAVLVHLIEEHARQLGHAGLLRGRSDGRIER